jgi:hypothetical protein
MFSFVELQETELAELDEAALRKKLEEMNEERATNSSGDRKKPGRIPVPANAKKEHLVELLREQSEGEAGTGVRYPNAQSNEEGGLVALAKKMRTTGGEPVPKEWIKLTYPGMDGAERGEIEISIELLPKTLADKRPAGQGRDAPNLHPELPEPEGRESFSMTSPFAALKALVGTRIYGQLCGMIYCVLLAACCWVMVPLVGSNLVTEVFVGKD